MLAPVKIDPWLLQQVDLADLKAAVHVAVDPVTDQRQLTVFTDDGHGNGNWLLTIDLV